MKNSYPRKVNPHSLNFDYLSLYQHSPFTILLFFNLSPHSSQQFPSEEKLDPFCHAILQSSKGLPLPGFTCSKLTIKTLQQGVKYVQS